MIYRVICTYHPDVGTFRGKRGAWRLVHCWREEAPWHDGPTVLLMRPAPGEAFLLLRSHKPRQRNSWCNPRKILAEYLEVMR